MKVVLTLKSFFKLQRRAKKFKKDTIHVKGISIFILFSKTFFKSCKVSMFFPKSQKLDLIFLKAPSRHKKFFHETFFEKFKVNIIYKVMYFNKKTYKHEAVILSNVHTTNLTFIKLNNLFDLFDSNTLAKCKFKVCTRFTTKLFF